MRAVAPAAITQVVGPNGEDLRLGAAPDEVRGATGGLGQRERLAKYERLLAIEGEAEAM